jgi:ankyrin repeat protein
MPSKKKRGQEAGARQLADPGLLDAATDGDAVAVTRLLAAGANPNASAPARDATGKLVLSTALFAAAGNGELPHGCWAAARLLLDAGADPNIATSSGITPLMAAAGQGHLEMLRLLLARGAAVDAVRPSPGGTAFHFACANNQPECAEALARAGCDVGIKTKAGQTGREVAEAEGHTEVVARLRAVVGDQLRSSNRLVEMAISAQAVGAVPAPEPAPVACDEAAVGAAPEPEPMAFAGGEGLANQLLTAVAEGDGAAVSRLLAAGADPNVSVAARNPSGEVLQTTALVRAATHGQLEAARLLLFAGADPSRAASDGLTPLIITSATGHLEVLQLLLGHGAAVDAVHPSNGGTAFHHACANNQAECAEALARVGCNLLIKDEKGRKGREIAEAKGHTALVARLRVVVGGLLALRAAGAPLAPAHHSAAPQVGVEWLADQLARAAAEGDGAAVARLLAAAADPNASVAGQHPSGEVVQTTALCAAAGAGRLESVRLLLDGGADPDPASSDGTTPLMAAAASGHLKVMRLLLERGAAVDAAHAGSGGTAFHHACYYNRAECAEALAWVGCDVGLKDKRRRTGREIAEGKGHTAVLEGLRVLEGHEEVVAAGGKLRTVMVDQLRAAEPAPEPAALAGDGGPADQLLKAVAEGDEAAVARLLASGTDPNASVAAHTPSGEMGQTTALCAAATHGRLEVVRLLLEGGADPSRAASDGFTPLMVAVFWSGHLEILRLLLARGAAGDGVHRRGGSTAFHAACCAHMAECAEALARAGCDVGIKAKNGLTGWDMAEQCAGTKDAARRLRALARQPFVGVLVELAGLVSAAKHNGKRAMVRLGRVIACSSLCFFSALALTCGGRIA